MGKMDKFMKNSKCNNWCCVPQCEFKRGRTLHRFPKDKIECKKWKIKLKIGRDITPHMFVCSSHFNEDDYIPRNPAMNPQRPRLKKKAVPSQNLPQRPLDKVKSEVIIKKNLQRLERLEKRRLLKENMSTMEVNGKSLVVENRNMIKEDEVNLESSVQSNEKHNLEDNYNSILSETFKHSNNAINFNDASINLSSISEESINLPVLPKTCDHEDYTIIEDDISDEMAENEAAESLLLLQIGNSASQENYDKENNSRIDHVDKKSGKEKKIKTTLLQLIKSNEDLKAFTNIDFALMNNLAEAIKLCEKKPNQFGISIKERIVLCLCKLYLNLSFKCLAVLFGVTRQTASHLFTITLNSLALILDKFIYWPTKEEIICSMPKCFDNFKQTYIVLDCTEIPMEKPSCLRCRLRLYSHYKGCETIKFLIGISPSGLIMYLSPAFGGRASDKAIFDQSGILKRLEPTRDAVMTDKGFAIEEECAFARVELIIPPKLGKKKQFTAEEVKKTVNIAAARVHVERAIQRIKLFKIFKSKISVQMAAHIDNCCKVICGIVNLSNSIMADDKF